MAARDDMSEEQAEALLAVGTLAQKNRAVTLEELCASLKWEPDRVRRVMGELVKLGLLNPGGAGGPN